MRLLNLSGPQDLMALLVRRKRWILYPFLALTLAAGVLAKILPKVYLSKATILIRPRDVPSDFVKDLTAGSTASRLSAIEQTVLSRSNLTKIANQFEGRFPEFKNLDMDGRVLKLRKAIKLNFSTNDTGSGQLPVTYFEIGFLHRDPRLAQQIALEITDLFMKKDAEVREKEVRGTVVFLNDELDKLFVQLKESDAKLKVLRSRHRNEMPNQAETNMRRLESALAAQSSQEEQNLVIDQYRRSMAERLRNTPKQVAKPVPPVVPVEVDEDPIDPEIVQQVAEWKDLKAKLKAMEKNGVGEKFPSYLIVQRDLDRLTKEMSPEAIALAEKKEDKPKPKPKSKPSEVEMMDNPNYLALLQENEYLERQIAIAEKKQAKNDASIQVFERRIDNVPQVEEDLADVLRENNDLNKQYNVMKDKLDASNLSLSLEFKQKGASFEVLDPANLPTSPSKPQKSMIVAIGALLSLVGGIAIGFVTDVANQKMWTASDVETFLGATVLVEIPEIMTPADTAAKRKKKWQHIIAVAIASVVYVAALYFVYLNQSFVVRQLEPYLQRLY